MKKVAIVEDNPDNRMLVRALLEDDYEIAEFEDGSTALEGLPAFAPDVILLDISLPGMDGPEVLTALRSSPLARTPVIALTAHAMDGDREKFMGLGFDGYVSKPIVDEDLLFGALEELLARTNPVG